MKLVILLLYFRNLKGKGVFIRFVQANLVCQPGSHLFESKVSMSSEKQKSRDAYRRALNPRRSESSDDDEHTRKARDLEKAVHGFSIPRY